MSSLQRLEPLLPKKFTTAENVDEARTKLTTLQAQREGVVATINLEELHLSYCMEQCLAEVKVVLELTAARATVRAAYITVLYT